jgi:hypothetical protein
MPPFWVSPLSGLVITLAFLHVSYDRFRAAHAAVRRVGLGTQRAQEHRQLVKRLGWLVGESVFLGFLVR